MEGLTWEKLEAVRKLLEMPADIAQDDELVYDVADRLPEVSGEYLTQCQARLVWLLFDASKQAWRRKGFIQRQAFPSHWLTGGKHALPVGDIRWPERAPIW